MSHLATFSVTAQPCSISTTESTEVTDALRFIFFSVLPVRLRRLWYA